MRYKFRYANGIYKTCAKIIVPLQNFFIAIAFFLLIYYLFGRLTVLLGVEDYLISDTVIEIVQEIILVFSALSAVVYCVFKKGVFLYDDSLVIARYTITPINWKPRITISYDEIERVNVNYTDLRFTKYRFSMVTPCGDYAYNVELTLKNGKKYFFSIQEQEEFCNNLNILIDKAKNMQN